MAVQVLHSLAEVPAAEWNSLQLDGHPFVQHEFLWALEQSGCASTATGWHARHLLLRDPRGKLLGAAPLYLKDHSWGEFVFDFAWANAYAQLGRNYYPKLVCAVPFTPATGPRLLMAADADAAAVRQGLLAAMIELAQAEHASSVHILFASEAELALRSDFLQRRDCQFHWHNRDYGSFDDFLATLRSDKRKKLLRERRRVHEAGLRFETLDGTQMSAHDWQVAFALSAGTFARHGHSHYLNVQFLMDIAKRLPQALVVVRARAGDQTAAVAICWRGRDTLYGRYWGAAEHYHSLHFETCYLQGIEYCISQGLQHFEPGTQGEHKIARGFEPTLTRSWHWLADPRLRAAVASYLDRETVAVHRYADTVESHLPFRREDLSD
jgi:uncharacterized protein